MNQTPQKQDAQFNQPIPRYPYQDDEISLVDLAKTLVKRRKLMALVFGFIVAAALVFALAVPPKYEYTTIYSGAEINADLPLESAESLQSKIVSIYIPQQIRGLLQSEQLEKLPFKVDVNSPKDTNLIKLTSKAKEADSNLVSALHQGVITQLKDEQDSQINSRVATLQKRLDATNQQLEYILATNDNKSGEIAASLMSTVSELESQISTFTNGSLVANASQSLEPQSIGKSLIMVLALVLGAMLAIIVAFFAEFAGRVCSSLQEEAE